MEAGDERVHFVVHDLDGKILKHGSCPEDWVELQAGDHIAMVVDEPLNGIDDFYVNDGVVTEKITIEGVEPEYEIAADGVEAVTFTLPPGTIVNFEGEDLASEENFSFTSDSLGRYRFLIIPPARFKSMEVVIHAV